MKSLALRYYGTSIGATAAYETVPGHLRSVSSIISHASIEPDIEIMGVVSGSIVPHYELLQRDIVGNGHKLLQAFLYGVC